MAIGQSNERLAAVKKHYPDDVLLISSCERLFQQFEREEQLKKDIKVSTGAWVHFLRGKARDGVRLALIFRAALPAIRGFLVGQ